MMRRLVALLRIDVSEERISSNIREERIGELGTLTVTRRRCEDNIKVDLI
jgi:hypothetical protein